MFLFQRLNWFCKVVFFYCLNQKLLNFQESMKMMGLSPVVYWMSWFVTVSIYLVIACFILTLLLSVKVNEYGSVLPHSDPTLTFIFFLCFAMSVTALSFMMSTFFKKGKNTNILLFPPITGWHCYLLTYMVHFPNYTLVHVLLLEDIVLKET